MHNLAAEQNIFRLPAASAALTHARPQPRLHRRLPANPSPQTVTSPAFINVLAGPRVDTPTRDHTVHRTPKNSAFITLLTRSQLDSQIRRLVDHAIHHTQKNSAFLTVLTQSQVNTQIRSLIDHTIHHTQKNSAFLNVLAVSPLDPGISDLNPGCFVTRTLPATLIPSR